MAEELIISTSSHKEEKYNTLLPQLESLVQGETDLVANLSNIAAALKPAPTDAIRCSQRLQVKSTCASLSTPS